MQRDQRGAPVGGGRIGRVGRGPCPGDLPPVYCETRVMASTDCVLMAARLFDLFGIELA